VSESVQGAVTDWLAALSDQPGYSWLTTVTIGGGRPLPAYVSSYPSAHVFWLCGPPQTDMNVLGLKAEVNHDRTLGGRVSGSRFHPTWPEPGVVGILTVAPPEPAYVFPDDVDIPF